MSGTHRDDVIPHVRACRPLVGTKALDDFSLQTDRAVDRWTVTGYKTSYLDMGLP